MVDREKKKRKSPIAKNFTLFKNFAYKKGRRKIKGGRRAGKEREGGGAKNSIISLNYTAKRKKEKSNGNLTSISKGEKTGLTLRKKKGEGKERRPCRPVAPERGHWGQNPERKKKGNGPHFPGTSAGGSDERTKEGKGGGGPRRPASLAFEGRGGARKKKGRGQSLAKVKRGKKKKRSAARDRAQKKREKRRRRKVSNAYFWSRAAERGGEKREGGGHSGGREVRGGKGRRGKKKKKASQPFASAN